MTKHSPVCVTDYELLAKEKLTENALGYYASGGTDEQTLHDNCAAFKQWRFRPRVLKNVSKVDITSDILGDPIPFPVCVAPTAMNRMASKDGEVDSAKAADSLKTGFTLSSWATTSIEEIAEKVPSVLRWFQLYVYKDRQLTKQLVDRAKRNGFRAILLTVDTPILGKRYRDMRNKFSLPTNFSLKNFESEENKFSKGVKGARDSGLAEYVSSLIDPELCWADVDWLRSITDLPIMAKGILTAEAALEAVQHGVHGIVVSNHGGRQLDGVLATINVLPEVVKAVNGRCEVYLDGGVRNGGDVAKAIALGAKAVFVGRPMIWGLACGGFEGGKKVLEILRDEFEITMKLLGVRSIQELQSVPNLVVHEIQEKLPVGPYQFFRGGGSDEQTLRENLTAFKRWRFRPRVLKNVSHVDTSSSVLGQKISFPVCVAPTSMNKLASENGEIDSARAANVYKTGFALSSLATTSIEDIAKEVPDGLHWLQVYILKDKNETETMIRRAEENGFKGILLTVDAPCYSLRYNTIRTKFSMPAHLLSANMKRKSVEKGLSKEQFESLTYPELEWKDFEWIKSITNLPVVVKGILTAEAALEAVQHGVDGIVVSNHGGRQLDGVLATINALPEVVKAVNGRCEVYLDGGVRNGGDVAKAIALGAKAVFVGRPMIWGLACGGFEGGKKVLEILRDEFEITMKLLGVRSIQELQSVPNLVVHESKIFANL